jgi:hypothetical protein
MKSDIAFAIIGALVGVTIAQFKGEMITAYLSKTFREGWQRVFRVPSQGDNSLE